MLFNIIFKQYLNIFIRNFVLCIQIRFVSTEKTTRIASRASCFFRFGNLHVSRSDMLRMAKPCALLGGFGGMPPQENFLKWCNLVRFGVYFDHILSLKNFKNYHFLHKKFKNCNFLYKIINIFDTRLLCSNYSREEIFWKIYNWCVLVCILK